MTTLTPTRSASHLAHLAVHALVEEALLTPKPALVDRRGPGAHHDLTLDLMLASAHTLEPWFHRMALASAASPIGQPLRERLAALGRQAEQAMLVVTRGVNTHRGAIWTLGLLVAASMHAGDPAAICQVAAGIASFEDRCAPQDPSTPSHGLQACARFGAAGARGQATEGFPDVLHQGLPTLHRARAAGHPEDTCRLHALLAIMSTLDDTCLLHRGGLAALTAAQAGARRCLSVPHHFSQLESDLLALWASPGGSADLLAATLFLDSLHPEREGK